MATINGATLQDIAYSGAAPLAAVHGKVTLAAAQINDKVRLNKVFAGTKIHDMKMINAALGASVTVDLGFEYVNGEAGGNAAYWLSNQACTNAAMNQSAAAPVTLLYDAYIIATVEGAAATGALDTVATFEFKGK